MDFLDSDFYKNSLNVLRDIRKSKLIETKFPELKYLISGDQIYQNLWKIIDESKVIIIRIFYIIVNSPIYGLLHTFLIAVFQQILP